MRASWPSSSRTDRRRPARLGLAAHQVGDLQGQHAGEGMDADVVLGPVEHRGERHDPGVFELPEGGLGLGLGPVAGDHLGGGPVVVIGDQHVLAEELFFQGDAGIVVDAPRQAQVAGLLAGQLPGNHPPHPGLAGNRGDLGLHPGAGPAGLATGQDSGQLIEFLAGLGQGGAGRTRGPGFRAARASR